MSLAPKILVADDDQALSRTLSWILKDNGYEVVTIPGGEGVSSSTSWPISSISFCSTS